MDLWEMYKASKGVPHSGDLYDALMGKSLGGGSVWETENAPYLFRASGGALNSRLLGKAKDKLVGASVGWNELIYNGNFASADGWGAQSSDSSLSVSGGVATVTVNSGNLSAYNPALAFGANKAPKGYVNHIYFWGLDVLAPINTTLYNGGVRSTGVSLTANTWKQIRTIYKATTLTSQGYVFGYLGVSPASGLSIGDSLSFKNFQLIDLTLMLGSSIADYIYTLEQGTAGAGVSKLREWGFMTEPYYAYDNGSLQSVNATKKITTGFNQWDEEWELGGYNVNTGEKTTNSAYIRSKDMFRIEPSTQYCFTKPTGHAARILFCDADRKWISSPDVIYTNHTHDVFTTPDNARYMNLTMTGTSYANDICINISNAELNGTYKAYEAHEYALDSDLILRGVPKLDADHNLYYDGDTYESSGVVSRKYGATTLTSSDVPSADSGYIGTTTYNNQTCVWIRNLKYSLGGTFATFKNGGYAGKTAKFEVVINDDQYYASQYRTLFIGVSSRDDLLTLIGNGLELIYELATPTTETADAFINPQSVSKYGTEEYVTSNGVPVGHETQYKCEPTP